MRISIARVDWEALLVRQHFRNLKGFSLPVLVGSVKGEDNTAWVTVDIRPAEGHERAIICRSCRHESYVHPCRECGHSGWEYSKLRDQDYIEEVSG